MILNQEFYLRRDVLSVAKDLLGKLIVSEVNGIRTESIIVETEAYRAPEDKGSHAHGNRRTQRTEVIFGQGGCSYVYLCYGIHQMFNVVTSVEGEAHAVLVRAVEPQDGIDQMMSRRKLKDLSVQLTNGPGKLTQALGINKRHNGLPLWNEKSGVHIWDIGQSLDQEEIVTGPRVGIAYAQEWANRPWRYRIKGNKWTSKPDVVVYH